MLCNVTAFGGTLFQITWSGCKLRISKKHHQGQSNKNNLGPQSRRRSYQLFFAMLNALSLKLRPGNPPGDLVKVNIERRRRAEATEEWRKRYDIRAGIEGTNSDITGFQQIKGDS